MAAPAIAEVSNYIWRPPDRLRGVACRPPKISKLRLEIVHYGSILTSILFHLYEQWIGFYYREVFSQYPLFTIEAKLFALYTIFYKLQKIFAGKNFSVGPEVQIEKSMDSTKELTALTRTPSVIITAQDWSGPDDPANPQLWPFWKKVYHSSIPTLLAFVV